MWDGMRLMEDGGDTWCDEDEDGDEQSCRGLVAVVAMMNFGVDGVAAVGDDGVEAAVLAGRVVHDALPAVGLQQRVLALHHVAVALLLGVLVVAGVGVLHAVLVVVLGVRLKQRDIYVRWSCSK